MRKVIFILGTSRSHGNTRLIIDLVNKDFNAPIIDLRSLQISYFDYEHQNRSDDFLGVIEKIVGCDVVVFATPVYWY